MAQITAEKELAEAELRKTTGQKPTGMTREELENMTTALGDLLTVLREADAKDKQEAYQQLGLRLRYAPGSRTIRAELKLDPDLPKRSEPGNVGQMSVTEDGIVLFAHIPSLCPKPCHCRPRRVNRSGDIHLRERVHYGRPQIEIVEQGVLLVDGLIPGHDIRFLGVGLVHQIVGPRGDRVSRNAVDDVL